MNKQYNTKKLAKAEVIFDRDHGTACRGWYVRLTKEDGQEIDEALPEFDSIGETPTRTQQAQLRTAARRKAAWNGLAVPRGLSIPIQGLK